MGANETPYDLVVRNTAEILTLKELQELLSKGEFSFYYGTAPTGPFHIAYFVPLTKLVDIIRAGGRATVLLADWHAYLDDGKTPWDRMELRSRYYYIAIKAFLRQFVDVDEVRFVFGHEFQRNVEYIEDLIRASGLVTVNRAIRAASEVVRMRENVHVSELIYPIMQILDVKHLGVDLALGGIDQRHIYALAREILPQLDYVPGVYVFTPIITALTGAGAKMSASQPRTTITVHDSSDVLAEKIRRAYCPWGSRENNPILDLYKYIVFPLFGEVELINSKTGATREYREYAALEQEFIERKIHPLDLKETLVNYLDEMLEGIRASLSRDRVVREVLEDYRRLGYDV